MSLFEARCNTHRLAILVGLGLTFGLAPQAALAAEAPAGQPAAGPEQAAGAPAAPSADGARQEQAGQEASGPAQEGPSDRGPAEGGQAGDAADGERPAAGSGPLVEGGSGQAGDAAYGPQGSPTPGSPESQAGQPATDAADDGSVEASEPDAPAGDGLLSVPPRQQAAGAASGAGSAAQSAPQAQGVPSGVVEGAWVVEDRGEGHGLQRYYVGADGRDVTGLFQAVIDGVASWFYGREDTGFVVRGRWDSGRGYVYLADNEGRLASGAADGWLVTDDYSADGSLQRYWIDGDEHAARSSYFQVGSQWYFGLGGEGYVLRGYGKGVDGAWLSADNDGRLAQDAWVVTDAFGQGLQRYWFGSDARIAEEGLVDAGGGWWAYVTDEGYVLRGKLDSGRGRVYLADNDGRLASLGADGRGSGWLVTGEYDGGTLQRYWIDGASHAAVSGFFTQALTAAGQGFFGVAGQGYVLRGTAGWGDQVLLADNDGVMASAPGWLVSDAYGQGLQRYWIEGVVGQAGYYAAKTGFGTSTDGVDFYGTNYGYVFRNGRIWRIIGDSWDVSAQADYCEADNDGKLIVLDNAYTRAVSAYITWALGIAADDSHGYDQQYRWGERGDYDCSALAVSALRQAGLNTGGASYTGNMRSELMKHGFVWITDLSQLQRGDILLSEGNHTAIYLGDGMLVHASGNEYGKAVGGRPGDQTGREVCWRDYYDYPWDGFLRLAPA